MPFKKGQSGNPDGPKEFYSFRAALKRAVVQDDGKRLRKCAESLLDLAAAGEAWAVKELADRLDGKATQSLSVELRDRTAEEMLDAELIRIAASGRAGTAEASGGSGESDRVH